MPQKNISTNKFRIYKMLRTGWFFCVNVVAHDLPT